MRFRYKFEYKLGWIQKKLENPNAVTQSILARYDCDHSLRHKMHDQSDKYNQISSRGSAEKRLFPDLDDTMMQINATFFYAKKSN